jgi:hypothetical protein
MEARVAAAVPAAVAAAARDRPMGSLLLEARFVDFLGMVAVIPDATLSEGLTSFPDQAFDVNLGTETTAFAWKARYTFLLFVAAEVPPRVAAVVGLPMDHRRLVAELPAGWMMTRT